MALVVSSFSPSQYSQLKHLCAFEGKNQILKTIGKNDHRGSIDTKKRISPLSIKCFKGQLIPSPKTLEQVFKTTNNGAVSVPVADVPQSDTHINVNDFPKDFMFGAATSAIQSEGALKEDGRGPSCWDSLITDGIAADSYHLYREDIAKLVEMGADCYRFSISWSRILPDGIYKGPESINQPGIKFYHNLIEDLHKAGITPIATLMHFDLPLNLNQTYCGFLDRDNIVKDFVNYADICFKHFGERVKHWCTINEPQVYALFIYKKGLPNGYIDDNVKNPLIVAHNILQVHGAVSQHYRRNYKASQNGQVGLPLSTVWTKPYSSTPDDKAASDRAADFYMGWFLYPLVYGDYPFYVKALVGDDLPTFNYSERAMVQGSCDFIGINYYSSKFAQSVPIIPSQTYTSTFEMAHVNPRTVDIYGNSIGEGVNDDFFICPFGLKDILLYIKNNYENPPVLITENGIPYEGQGEGGDPKKDKERISFMTKHFEATLEALKAGSNVKGFMNWSLMDLQELGAPGYAVKMGLLYIDYTLMPRTRQLKDSAIWLKEFLAQRKK